MKAQLETQSWSTGRGTGSETPGTRVTLGLPEERAEQTAESHSDVQEAAVERGAQGQGGQQG